jgi:hypothetical protein
MKPRIYELANRKSTTLDIHYPAPSVLLHRSLSNQDEILVRAHIDVPRMRAANRTASPDRGFSYQYCNQTAAATVITAYIPQHPQPADYSALQLLTYYACNDGHGT